MTAGLTVGMMDIPKAEWMVNWLVASKEISSAEKRDGRTVEQSAYKMVVLTVAQTASKSVDLMVGRWVQRSVAPTVATTAPTTAPKSALTMVVY